MATLADDQSAGSGNKKLTVIIALLGVLVLGLGVAVGYLFMHKESGAEEGHAAKKVATAPVFEKIDTFVVNLGGQEGGMLQTELQVQLNSPEGKETLKAYMPKIRSNIILLLSSKTYEDVSSAEGKAKLKNQIRKIINESLAEAGEREVVSAVLFTSFIVQM